MNRRYAIFSAAFAIACVASSAVIDRVIRALDAFVRFVFAAVTPAPAFAFAGRTETWGGTRTFADPHVARHEAGMSRRAADRHT